jgi:2,3,4,5-tetrahydropyridine-2,6-dicarboxylate N-succinyltransferase
MDAVRETLQEAFAGRRDLESRDVHEAFTMLLRELEAGRVRAAELSPDGAWQVHTWVKEGILVGFRIGRVIDMSTEGPFRFFDKHTLPVQDLGLDSRVRIVPGGTTIRSGAHVGANVILMPPAYVNVGAYVGSDTMIDSHALVGSCAQIGCRVHISAAAQIGGVLEPPGARPVILEDDVLVGGNCGIYEGTLVRRRAVLGAGVVLTASTPLYDVANERILRPEPGLGLEVPEGAVVVPGARRARGAFAAEHGLGLYAPIIVKYRDASTDARTALESALRESGR